MNTCFIFGAADGLPQKFKKDKSDLVIAADSGLKHTSLLNINPDLCLGDFDSLGFIPKQDNVKRFPVKKDDTDSMLAVKEGLKRNFKKFILYGCTGGRPDHMFANLQTLNYISSHGGMGILCGNGFCAAALKDGKVTFSPNSKGYISIYSVETSAENVTVKGLEYSAENITLNFDFPLGQSNKFIGERAEISVERGTLLIIWEGTPENMLDFAKK